MKYLSEAVAFPIDGEDYPSEFQALTDLPIVVIVGLTGVGKSTTLDIVKRNGILFSLLPNRREITDHVIIASLQQEDGETFHPVLDRIKRFEYTARYREKYDGGMAFALSKLIADPSKLRPLILFDGLRGLNEVQHAVEYFPNARFIVLDASDMIRLTRLLKRDDAFDTTAVNTTSLAGQNLIAAFMDIPNIEAVFDEEQLRQLARVARAAGLSSEDLVKKARIIVEERRNYDPDTARVFLMRHQKSNPVLVIDTSKYTIEEVAQQITDWLRAF